MIKKKQELNGGGSAAVATATAPAKSKSKKTEIVKPEKVLREGLQKRKKIYEDEGWRFTEDQNNIPPKRWTAINSSPIFPKLFGESLSLIFSRIENLISENGDYFRLFIETRRAQFDAGELPEDWQSEKTALEATGWQFEFDTEKREWSGVHANFIGAEGANNFGSLLGIIRKNIREKKADVQPEPVKIGAIKPSQAIFQWNPPITQTIPIAKFIASSEAKVIYVRQSGAAEIEYTDKAKNIATSVFFDLGGSRHEKCLPEYGSYIPDSILTIEEFFIKFPYLEKYKIAREVDSNSNSFDEIDLGDIVPSPFEGQKRRRARFTDEEISELTDSIKAVGVLQPIVVRQSRKFTRTNNNPIYEIIAGERRFLAAQKAGLESIPAVIKNVSDQVAFEIQTIENLQRKDPDPIDEAFAYSEYIEKYNFSVDDLSVKFGKPVKFIAGRLRLKSLIPEVLEDITAGHLPLGHAFEIAKLAPEIQKQAHDLCFDTKYENGEWVPDKTDLRTLSEFRSELSDEIFLYLKNARFSLQATNLRFDGLACVNCPERTGAAGSLFEDLHEAKNDRCLNAVCFHSKTTRLAQITREERSAELIAEGKAAEGYKMPIIVWQPSNQQDVENQVGERPLADGDYVPINNNTGECESMEFGVFVDDSKFGEVIKICRFADCGKHARFLRSNSSNSTAAVVPGEKTDAEKREFYKRKQEIFDIKVGEPVRKKVLREAAKTFTGERWIFDNEIWRLRLTERLWERIDGNARTVIKDILEWKSYTLDLKRLSSDELSKVLFLAIIANEGEMLYGSWRDQKQIVAVAEEFGVNYALLDAQERASAAPKKFKDAAKEHLGKIERGEKVTRPVFYKLEK